MFLGTPTRNLSSQYTYMYTFIEIERFMRNMTTFTPNIYLLAYRHSLKAYIHIVKYIAYMYNVYILVYSLIYKPMQPD